MKNSNYIKTVISIVVVAILVLTGIWFMSKPNEVILQGRIEAKEVYLSAKIPSRLLATNVKEGDYVTKGQLLATLASPEMDAKEEQVLASIEAARAQQNKAINGARPEEISAARSIYEKAKAASNVMQKTYKRVENLYKDGVVSEQKRDEAFAKKEAAVRDEQAAYSQYQIAVQGARKEDIASASAMVKKADGALNEIQSFMNERNITSTMDGEVLEFLPEEGELIGAGYPVVHLVDLNNSYAVINVKETLLSNFSKEQVFKADIPALDLKDVEFKIYYIAALGDYATWNATKATGEFDVRTFEIKAEPINKEIGLRPGMSILVDSAQFDN